MSYDVNVDPTQTNDSHALVVDLVGTDARVLDVGCWRGDLARPLQDRDCVVSGFEVDKAAAEQARERMAEVVVGDLNETLLSAHFEPGSFDVVVFADVLEHVLRPLEVLRDAKALLASGGRVVLSIPNVSHGSLRLAHLQGRWDLTETGLLDRTHIQFFNRGSLLALVDDAGFEVVDFRCTLVDPMAAEVRISRRGLPPGAVWWVRRQPDAFVYQFQLAARVRDDSVSRSTPPLAMQRTPAQLWWEGARRDIARLLRRRGR